MSVKDVDHGRVRIVCTKARESGVCNVRAPFYLDAIERAVVGGLCNRLTDTGAIDLYLRVYNEERKRLASEATQDRSKLEGRLNKVEGDLKRIVRMLVSGTLDEDDVKDEVASLKIEKAKLSDRLKSIEAASNIVMLHPPNVAQYVRQMAALEEAINQGTDEGSDASKNALRDLIEAVVITREKNGQTVKIEVRSRLAYLIGGYLSPEFELDGNPPDQYTEKPKKKKVAAGARVSEMASCSSLFANRGGTMVAEEGLEPPTQGL